MLENYISKKENNKIEDTQKNKTKQFNFRTDLANERRDIYKKANSIENEINGIESTKEEINENISVERVKITNEEGAKAIGKPQGNYITIDIKKLNGGNYSNVIEIGDKILKIGSERMRFNIPNNEHILVPIIRKDLSIISDIPMVIEVSEKVDTKVNLTDDELYQIYKDLRINGIIWTDVKNDNLGRLLKDNIVHYDNVLLDNEAKGIEGTSTKTLKKGEYVIIDTDFIYDEDDENIKWGNMKSMMFETRYINELNNKENVHKM